MSSKKTFESSLSRLTEIVERLERDDTPLADAMKLYEEGIVLSRDCRRELEQAELRIVELRRQNGGDDDQQMEE